MLPLNNINPTGRSRSLTATHNGAPAGKNVLAPPARPDTLLIKIVGGIDRTTPNRNEFLPLLMRERRILITIFSPFRHSYILTSLFLETFSPSTCRLDIGKFLVIFSYLDV